MASIESEKIELGNSPLVKNSVLTSVELSKVETGVGSAIISSVVLDNASSLDIPTSTLLVSEKKIEETKKDIIPLSAVPVGETDISICPVESTSGRPVEGELDVNELVANDLDRTNASDGSTGKLESLLPSVNVEDVTDNEETVGSSTKLENCSIVIKVSSKNMSVLSADDTVDSSVDAIKLTLSTNKVGSTSEILTVGVDSTSTVDGNTNDDVIV